MLLVLRTDEALQAFCSAAHLGVCGSASAALGPVGRRAQAGLQVGAGGGGAVAGYSCSRGAFVGVAIEGSLFVVRDAANLAFYGARARAAGGACTGAASGGRARAGEAELGRRSVRAAGARVCE